MENSHVVIKGSYLFDVLIRPFLLSLKIIPQLNLYLVALSKAGIKQV